MGTEALRIQPGIQSGPLATSLPASRTSQTWPGRRGLQTRTGGSMSPEDRASETELIRQAQKGSRQAFDTLVRQYDQAVLRLALHLTGSDGGDTKTISGTFITGDDPNFVLDPNIPVPPGGNVFGTYVVQLTN